MLLKVCRGHIMGLEFLAFCVAAIFVVVPITVLVLQFSLLGRQKKLTEQLERMLPEWRRHFAESRKLLEDVARRARGAEGPPITPTAPAPIMKKPWSSKLRSRARRCWPPMLHA